MNGYDEAVEQGFITQEQADGAKAAEAKLLNDLDIDAFFDALEALGLTEDDEFEDLEADLEAINDELCRAADLDRGQKVA